MKNKNLKYIFLGVVLGFSASLYSCSDDELLPSDPSSGIEDSNGDVINLTVTLDKMGGAAASRATPSELEYLESYVNPEKLRVLFFDKDDKFLFESKSRWIKQLDPTSDHSSWSVSVPLYAFGNDREYDWDWEAIRTKLTTEDFKVAILANRPEREWNMGITNKDDATDTLVAYGWFGSTGPDWRRKNSVVYTGADKDVKDVFDLHHCQYDPIYDGKNYNNTLEKASANRYYYDFITKDVESNPNRPYMGATSSWVEWGENDDNNKDPYGWNYRRTRMPTEDNPIPLYGIQKFSALTNWKKGTSIDLPSEKPISLLRSVVKLELLVPEGFARDVVLFYPNIYARCEPMNVWTPTDEVWRGVVNNHNSVCEMDRISKYGLITKVNDPTDNDDVSKAAYQKRLSWFYGSWLEKDWDFNGKIDVTANRLGDNANNDPSQSYPNIFNPCIQRNNVLYVEKTYTAGGYDHYVVYTGERNVNDPAYLYSIGDTGSGSPTVVYWCVVKNGNIDALSTYSLPIVDYAGGASVYNTTREGVLISYTTNGVTSYAPRNSPRAVGCREGSSNGTGMGEYMRRVMGSDADSRYYRVNDNGGMYTGKDVPLPLIRNHYYKITLTSNTDYSRSGNSTMNVRSEVLATEDIGFGGR